MLDFLNKIDQYPLQMTPTKLFKLICMSTLLAFISACGGGSSNNDEGSSGSGDSKPIKVVYVTNGVDPFWNIAENGALAAAKEFDVNVEVYMPPNANIQEQIQYLETQLILGVDGVAISPIKPEAQNDFLNKIAKQTRLITHDSDAPESNRLCFIGMDNYKAGRSAGKLVKEAIPNGGKVMLYVGRMDQLNARQRRQGVIDEILDKPMQSGLDMVETPVDEIVSNEKYSIVGTRTDGFLPDRAMANAQDTINSMPDIACMVGLFAYNITNCLQAVRQAGKVGEIALVSFDEYKSTLDGIKEGDVYGTISQQPFQYGYDSVRILAGLAREEEGILPENAYLEIPIIEVRKDNVGPFSEKVAELSVSPSSKK